MTMDGINQWRTISRRAPPRRKEFIYGMNEISGRAAIRLVYLIITNYNYTEYILEFIGPLKKKFG